MVYLSIMWQYSLFLLAFILSFSAYGKEKAEEVFEKTEEEKVEAGTTFFITPRAIKQNYRKYHRIDRSVTKLDHFTVAEAHHYNFQDLGNHWTAAQHIFYRLPEDIGVTYGLSTYDFYFKAPQDIGYYYTKKAYAYFNIVLANLGSFFFDGCYTQRLLENWHIGMNLHGAMTEKEWPHGKDDKIINGFPHLDVFTHMKSPDERYHLFMSGSNKQYLTKETGGVRSNRPKDAFKFDEKNPSKRYRASFDLLDEAYMKNKMEEKVMHKEIRRNFYCYHHYEFSKPIQLYHELNYNHKKNLYAIKDAIKELDDTLLTFISEQDDKLNKEEGSIVMQSFGNEIGIKGDIEGPDLFYAVHYTIKKIDLNYDFSTPDQRSYKPPLQGKKPEKEHYLGANTRWHFSKDRTLYLDGAYLLQKGGYHKVNLAYQAKFFKVACHTLKHKVPYILSYGYSRHRQWNNAFEAPSAQAIDTAVWYRWPHITIHPILALKRLNNYICYTKARLPNRPDHCIAEPIQATTPIYLLSLEGNLDFSFFSYFHFDHNLTLEWEVSKKKKFFKGYIPPYMYTLRYYYADQPYDKKMDVEAGMNIHFKALYYGDGYDVIAQQFYRQNQFPTQGRPIVDLFYNMRINNLKISLKYSFINDFLNEPSAYFATPFYPGLKKAADIGIHWSFFD